MSRRDLRGIEGRYEILHLDDDCVELWCRTSGHFWRIREMMPDYYIIQHKHRCGEKYHPHNVAVTFNFALDKVRGHDKYNAHGCKRRHVSVSR